MENSEKEIDEIMKKNEELMIFQKKCDEEIKNLEKENELKKEEIKTKNNQE